ncbi:UNVERIFIED_ORG: glycosyltransferase involved in cell wall biosynthesis [Chitinophaga ginsengisegetis]
MQIMHLVTGLNVGGAERVVLDLSIAQKNANLAPIVVCLTEDDKLLPIFQKEGIEVIFLNVQKNPASYVGSLVKLLRLVKTRNISILHCHMFHPVLYASPIKILKRSVKVFFTSHSFNIGSKFREVITGLTKSLRSADIIFSSQMKRWFYKKNKTFVIPNGVSISDYEGSYRKFSRFTFLCAARLEEVKNHGNLLQAAAILKKKHDFQLLLAGTGILEAPLKLLQEELGLKDNVQFLGYRSDIPALMNQSHCYLLVSLWEGLPISILEAFACGIPVIASPVGSIPEFFSSEEIVFANKTPEDIARCMEDVIDNYSRHLDRSEKVKDRIAKDFDISKISEIHSELYKNC